MKTKLELLQEQYGETILAFHVGRGGHFHNAGHLLYYGEYPIGDYTDDLFVHREYEEELSRLIGDRPNLREKFEDCRDSDDWSFFEKRGFDVGKQVYFTCSGKQVGLELDNDGTGCIDIDMDYNTTYCIRFKDLSEEEFKAIKYRGRGYYGPLAEDVDEIKYYEEEIDIYD